MKDIKGFCKLFSLNVPVYEHFDYYIDQLSKTQKFKDIKSMIPLFEKAEDSIDDMYQYRVDKSNEIISFLQSTRAYEDLIYDNLIPDLPVTKNFMYQENKKYLSIDLRQANWQSLKGYDPEFLNELGDTYYDFLSKFDLAEVFKHSKQFRQFIFGNINPKKQIKFQRKMIQNLIDSIGNSLQIECIKHDEVIYSYNSIKEIQDVLKNIINDNRYNIKLFTIERVEDFRIDNYLDLNDNIVHREMVGCNGNLFFWYLKKYITNEQLNVLDLYFRVDNKFAIWSHEDLKVSL